MRLRITTLHLANSHINFPPNKLLYLAINRHYFYSKLPYIFRQIGFLSPLSRFMYSVHNKINKKILITLKDLTKRKLYRSSQTFEYTHIFYMKTGQKHFFLNSFFFSNFSFVLFFYLPMHKIFHHLFLTHLQVCKKNFRQPNSMSPSGVTRISFRPRFTRLRDVLNSN